MITSSRKKSILFTFFLKIMYWAKHFFLNPECQLIIDIISTYLIKDKHQIQKHFSIKIAYLNKSFAQILCISILFMIIAYSSIFKAVFHQGEVLETKTYFLHFLVEILHLSKWFCLCFTLKFICQGQYVSKHFQTLSRE